MLTTLMKLIDFYNKLILISYQQLNRYKDIQKTEEVYKVNQSKELIIAEKIIELDLKRDELFEELMLLLGSKAYELLRTVQNH